MNSSPFCFMDTVDKPTRSKIMSSVKQKDTRPEMKLRKSLHKAGFRYRLHDNKLPGTPDIVFRKYSAVIFVHGCFWHRHGCKFSTFPLTNNDFWQKKFKSNIIRDKKKTESLLKNDWRVLVMWECTLKIWRDKEITKAARDWLISEISYKEM